MTTATVKRRPPTPSTPGLTQRVEALLDEVLSAPAGEQREAIAIWRNALDKALDNIAAELAPKGRLALNACGQPEVVGSIPAGYIRQQLDIAGGHCHCRAYAAAVKTDAMA